MNEVALIFPHQLFKQHPAVPLVRRAYLIEEYLFFSQYRFHKQKLTFHRATMKFYEQYLKSRGIEVSYIESEVSESDIRNLLPELRVDGIHVADPVDNYLMRRLTEGCQQARISLTCHPSPGFLNTLDELSSFFSPTKKKFFQTEFYINERKKRRILLDQAEQPIGGKWTFDAENRKKYPRGLHPPAVQFPSADDYFEEAKQYVAKNYPTNPGYLNETPLYPLDFQSSNDWLRQFMEHRFSHFGDYEDAIVSKESILNHSVLSPLINVGLITPEEVIKELLGYASQHNISINNTEGIIRQLIGWREFIRGVYEVKGTAERTRNFWEFTRKIPASFYTGTTGIEPVDMTIKKLLKTGYNHHIERLMVLGNFMVLCEFDPDEVYRWFMELYIDAYDWVMVPNVYGMSQFADGGMMSTKPYISGSNYLLKMSDYKKGPWTQIWDGLFWRFMDVHREFFLKNPRLGMLIRTYDKMSEDKKQKHHQIAEEFIAKISSE